ncbi:MAG: hypothetical protein LBR53_03450 [Deltaproteobacteria bacterium]|jgi:predicted RNA-binding Zn-ribbon protein involved in translation (DUF1610 family)|nr:hypothetical protein [Deltaproteobacteria bacterium]
MANIKQINCKSCGAAIDLQPGVFEYACQYCGTKNSIIDPNETKEQLPQAPEKLILITRDAQQNFHNFVLQTMAFDMNAPDDMVEKSEINEELVYYVPCYFMSGSVKADWTASFGYDRQEPYTDYESYTDSKGRTRTRPVTRYRTVTDWRPASGKASGRLFTQAYAGEPLPSFVETSLNHMRGDFADYSPTMVTGCEVKPFIRTVDDVHQTIAAQIDAQIQNIVYSYAQGDHQRDWSYNPDVTVDYIKPGLLPLAKASFTYHEKKYDIYASATSQDLYYKDDFPVDHKRKNKVSRGFVPFYITLIYSIFFGFLFSDYSGYFNFILILMGLACPLLLGITRSATVNSYSKKVRAAALAQRNLNQDAQLKTQEQIQALYQQSQKPPMPFFAKDGADDILLPLLTFLWLGFSLAGFAYHLITH